MGKYFIDHENKIRECAVCGGFLPFSEFPINCYRGTKVFLRSECKPCHKARMVHQIQLKQMLSYPDKYVQCSNEECNTIWKKFRKYKTISQCPKCGAEPEQSLAL